MNSIRLALHVVAATACAAAPPSQAVADPRPPSTAVSTAVSGAIQTLSGRLPIETDPCIPRTDLSFALLPAAGIEITPARLDDRSGLGAAVSVSPPPLRDCVRLGLEGATRGYDRGRVAVGPRWLTARYV